MATISSLPAPTVPQIPPPTAAPTTTTTPPQTTNPKPAPASPSPLESQRVTALLDINHSLLSSLIALQSAQKQDATAPPPTPAKIAASKVQYMEYMRRLQSNLAYLASIADRAHKPPDRIPLFPAIMEAPSADVEGEGGTEGLREMYGRLRELWPEFKGKGQGLI